MVVLSERLGLLWGGGLMKAGQRIILPVILVLLALTAVQARGQECEATIAPRLP